MTALEKELLGLLKEVVKINDDEGIYDRVADDGYWKSNELEDLMDRIELSVRKATQANGDDR